MKRFEFIIDLPDGLINSIEITASTEAEAKGILQAQHPSAAQAVLEVIQK